MECGLQPIPDWPSVYFDSSSHTLLMVYVDDFMAAGPPAALAAMWERLRPRLRIGDPGPVSVFLGCTQRESSMPHPSLPITLRVLEYDMEDFLLSSLALFQQLTCDVVSHTSPTPYLGESLCLDPLSPADVQIPVLPAGRYATVAARILMKLLYSARMARPELLRPIIALACYMHAWTVVHDKALLRLLSYVKGSLDLRQWSWIDPTDTGCHLHVFADADFAGCHATQRSTSGITVQFGSQRSHCPASSTPKDSRASAIARLRLRLWPSTLLSESAPCLF